MSAGFTLVYDMVGMRGSKTHIGRRELDNDGLFPDWLLLQAII